MDNCYTISSTYHLMFIIFCVWIVYISGTGGVILTPPENVAMDYGSNTVLNCITNTSIYGLNFQPVASSGNIPIVGLNCVFIPGSYSCNFSVSSTSSASNCQLIITNASLGCAGFYICSDTGGSSTPKSAMAIVLNSSSPYCSANATNNTLVEESTPVSMSCAVSYTTPSLEPQLNWSSPSFSTYSNSSYAYSSVSFVNTIPLLPSTTCDLTFPIPTTFPTTNPPSTLATNAPSYTSSCTVAAIAPVYCPVDMLITPSDNKLTCLAQSNPAATYQWYGPPSDTLISNTPIVNATVAGNYTCVATNIAESCSSSSSLNFTLNSGSTLEWWAWLLIGLGIAATIGTVIFIVWRLKKRVPAPPEPTPVPAPVPVKAPLPVLGPTPEEIASKNPYPESKDTDNKLTEQMNEPSSKITNNEGKFETTKSSENSPSDDGKIRPTHV